MAVDLQEFAQELNTMTVKYNKRFRVMVVLRDGLIIGGLLSVVVVLGLAIFWTPQRCYVAYPDGRMQEVDCK